MTPVIRIPGLGLTTPVFFSNAVAPKRATQTGGTVQVKLVAPDTIAGVFVQYPLQVFGQNTPFPLLAILQYSCQRKKITTSE